MIGTAAVVSLLGAGAAQAALQDRNLDGNGQTDAFYDTDLDITWLRDANVNGLMNWDAAVSWAISGEDGLAMPEGLYFLYQLQVGRHPTHSLQTSGTAQVSNGTK